MLQADPHQGNNNPIIGAQDVARVVSPPATGTGYKDETCPMCGQKMLIPTTHCLPTLTQFSDEDLEKIRTHILAGKSHKPMRYAPLFEVAKMDDFIDVVLLYHEASSGYNIDYVNGAVCAIVIINTYLDLDWHKQQLLHWQEHKVMKEEHLYTSHISAWYDRIVSGIASEINDAMGYVVIRNESDVDVQRVVGSVIQVVHQLREEIQRLMSAVGSRIDQEKLAQSIQLSLFDTVPMFTPHRRLDFCIRFSFMLATKLKCLPELHKRG